MDAKKDHGSIVLLSVTGLGGRGTRQFDNWLGVDFQRSVEGVVGQATLTLPFSNRIQLSTLVEKRAQLSLIFEDQTTHEIPLMTGYIKSAKITHKSAGPMITLVVKDQTIDLVECHPITSPPKFGDVDSSAFFDPSKLTPANFVGMNLGSICKAFCTPFGIDVVDSVFEITPFTENIVVEEETTVFSQIADLCKKVGAVPTTDAKGRLRIGQLAYEYRTQATTRVPHSIEYMETVHERGNPGEDWNTIGEADVLEFEHSADLTHRFSDYKVVYSETSIGEQYGTGISSAQWSQDGGVRRWRPKVVRPTHTYDGDKDKYATWLSQTQRGNSNSFTMKLRYWYKRQANGWARIFEIGELLKINLPKWGFVTDLVITGVHYQLDGHGARTLTVTMKHKDTYSLVPKSDAFHDPIVEDVEEIKRTVRAAGQMYVVGMDQQPQPLQKPEVASYQHDVEDYERTMNSGAVILPAVRYAGGGFYDD